jgi:hypothetical protein
LQRLVAQYEEAFCMEKPLSPQVSTLSCPGTHSQPTATGTGTKLRCHATSVLQTPGAGEMPESPQAMAAYAAGYAAGFYTAQSSSSVSPGQL